MRIAMISPPWIAVPPAGYGGIEWVVSLLVEELVERGHDVTLFASGGSKTKAELIGVFDEPPTARMHLNVPDARHAQRAITEIVEREGTARAFDVVHDHSACIFLALAPLLPVPMVHTIHGAFTDEMKQLYGNVPGNVSFVGISASQCAAMPELNVAAVVPNAVDVNGFPFRAEKQDYLLCLGRVCRDKGQDVAIAVAHRAGLPLVIAGKVDPGDDRTFFDEHVLPHLDGEHVRFEGEVSDERKRELVANARGMLFPIRWPEPFGLVMIEAMACGTPVIAFPCGAVPEILEDGISGFVVNGEEAALDAIRRIAALDRRRVRASFERRFTAHRMAEAYVAIYRRLIAATEKVPIRIEE